MPCRPCSRGTRPVDASPNAAYQRAAIYLSGDLAQQADKAAEPRPGSQWEQWRADGADDRCQVYFVADETPPNSDDQVHRVVVIVQSATDCGQQVDRRDPHTAWVIANKSNDGWRVTSIQF